jgi:hypothetical protein
MPPPATFSLLGVGFEELYKYLITSIAGLALPAIWRYLHLIWKENQAQRASIAALPALFAKHIDDDEREKAANNTRHGKNEAKIECIVISTDEIKATLRDRDPKFQAISDIQQRILDRLNQLGVDKPGVYGD